MTWIRRTAARALLGLAAALVVGYIGASTDAPSVDSSTTVMGVQARDFVW
jgi:hypothetical protein